MDEDLRDAARTIRPYLVELVGPDEAVRLDGALAGLLADATRGEDVTAALRAALTGDPVTRAWVDDFLDDAERRPPGSRIRDGGYAPLPGHGVPIGADRFACPHGDYVWYRWSVGEPVAPCPTHGPGLVPD